MGKSRVGVNKLWLGVTACPTCFCEENGKRRLLTVGHSSHSCFHTGSGAATDRGRNLTRNKHSAGMTSMAQILFLPKYLEVKQGGLDHLASCSSLVIWRYHKGPMLTLTTWSYVLQENINKTTNQNQNSPLCLL